MNLGALVASLGVDSSGLWEAEKDMEQFASNVQKDMEKTQSKLDEVGGQFQDFGEKASVVSAIILAAGGYAFKMASDMEESINKVDVAFKSSAENIKDWSEGTLVSFGIAQGTALDMTALYGDMATGMGLATNAAADMSKTLVGLAGDLSSFKNIGIEQTQTALAGIFTGETESLKRLGIVMTETNLQEYALAQGIMKKVDAMNQAEKVQLRYNYVLSVTQNAQGDFMRTQGGAANQMRIFSESIKEISASFGKLLLPSITSMFKWVNGLMQKIGALDDTTKKWVIGIGIAVAAIGPLAFIIGSVMKAFALLTTVVGVTAGAFSTLTAAMLANPIGAIAAVLGIATLAWINYRKSIDYSTSAQKVANEVHKKSIDLIAQETGTINSSIAILKSFDSSRADKILALSKINQLSPEYLGGITEEAIRTGKANTILKDYIKYTKQKIEVQVASDLLTQKMTEHAKQALSGEAKQLNFWEKARVGGLAYASGINFLYTKKGILANQTSYLTQKEKEYHEEIKALLKLMSPQITGIEQTNKVLNNQITHYEGLARSVTAASKVFGIFNKTQSGFVMQGVTFPGKSVVEKVDVNQKVLEANAQAALSFQGLTTDTNLFGKSLEDNQNKLAVYTTQLAALKAAGITGGQGIKIIADRIIGLQTAISMTKLPNVSAVKSISSNYVPTKTKGGTFDKGLSTASPEIIADTVALGNMASVYERVAVAQEKLSNQTTMWQKLNNGVGLLTSSLQSLSNIGNSLGGTFGKVFDTFLQGFQIISDVVNIVRSMVSLTKLLTVAETAKTAVTASGIGVTLAAAAAETVKAEASTASAIAGAASSTAWIPIVGVALAVAGIAALMIAMSSAKNKTKVPGMANGGIVPSGYPNDSYPAMLTSGETVVPPDKLGADFGRRSKQEVVFKIGHRELIAVLKDSGILNNSF